MYYAYVLQNPKGVLYKGYTNDLRIRVEEHNSARSGSFTHGRGPWTLVYYEEYNSKKDAKEREQFFKSGKGREFLNEKIRSGSESRKVQ